MDFWAWLRGLFSTSPKAPPRDAPPPAPVSPVPVPSAPIAPPRDVPLVPGLLPITPAVSGKLNLDAGDFLPITRAELKEEAKDVRRGGAWFGRRDLIPPADDPRTKLIDRDMVTQGLLTPDQLIEIHQVGAEMERVRPSTNILHQQAGLVGEAAVQAEREGRAQLKAQKKAETAARKQRHADDVAHRRATDIRFLGRGVSGRLGDRTSDAAKLQSLELPVVGTPAELAAALGLSVPRLRWLAFHTDVATRVHYVHFTVPKKSGGTRTLSAPHRSVAAAQRWVFENIVRKLPVEAPAHGFLPCRGILTNAKPHTGQAVVVNLDLKDFFPCITFPRVRSVFHRLGYSPAVATVLALLCTECPRQSVEYDGQTYHVALGPRGLPQGACTSPGLSNQVARRLDKRLGGLAAKLGIAYTRYADDLTFSGGPAFNEQVGYLMARVRHLAEAEGFAVNDKKSRVQRRNAPQLVTGLVVNDKPGVVRKDVRRLRAILHRARFEGLEKQNREGRPHFLAWLQGKIAYVGMARPEVGQKLQAELNRLLKK